MDILTPAHGISIKIYLNRDLVYDLRLSHSYRIGLITSRVIINLYVDPTEFEILLDQEKN